MAWGIVGAAVALRKFKKLVSCGHVARLRVTDHSLQHFAVTNRADRQPMPVIPNREATFLGIVAQRDLAPVQRVGVGNPEKRKQHSAARMSLQALPVDIEEWRVDRFWSTLQHIKPPGTIGV